MSIKIVGAPRLAEDPEFGARSVLVPLNETPSATWLSHFRANKLPGHAHRVVENGIVFELDRNDMDLVRRMRDVAKAVETTNANSAAAAEDDEKAAIQHDSETASKRKKLDEKLANWWAEHQHDEPEALPPGDSG